MILAVHRKGELKARARTVLRDDREPPPVILDDGATNRQAHTQAPGFGGVERIEDPRHRLRVEPDARVAHRHTHFIGLALRLDYQLARAVLRATHRLDPVHDEIQHYLLDQHAVAPHRRGIPGPPRA